MVYNRNNPADVSRMVDELIKRVDELEKENKKLHETPAPGTLVITSGEGTKRYTITKTDDGDITATEVVDGE